MTEGIRVLVLRTLPRYTKQKVRDANRAPLLKRGAGNKLSVR